MIIVAIILDDYIDIKTHAYDLSNALQLKGEQRFCFDFGALNQDSTKTYFPIALIPLNKEFRCERTLVYEDGKKVEINSTFGMFEDDFINIEVPHIEIKQANFIDHGIIVSNWNKYFDIFNALAKEFKFIKSDNEKSFILSNSELMEFAHVPFTLYGKNGDFIVENIEDELPRLEFNAYIESFVIDDVAL